MGIDNMHHVIRLFESLLRIWLPATGRHRPVCVPLAASCADAPRPTRRRRGPVPHTELLRGEDSPLVRPYVPAMRDMVVAD
ncbi:hypothetical protein B1H19_23550 [Streptomyces gilvosporeus]|uniref:Uncharacterized protein n=2 Tax=Streptomyces gilvosporeus TaxID=553510 RepID=A0A1V0TV65_9ACTN|nr:hypothetical protein B1H19_23550 [Streptomyces gilvosporeus]